MIHETVRVSDIAPYYAPNQGFAGKNRLTGSATRSAAAGERSYSPWPIRSLLRAPEAAKGILREGNKSRWTDHSARPIKGTVERASSLEIRFGFENRPHWGIHISIKNRLGEYCLAVHLYRQVGKYAILSREYISSKRRVFIPRGGRIVDRLLTRPTCCKI